MLKHKFHFVRKYCLDEIILLDIKRVKKANIISERIAKIIRDNEKMRKKASFASFLFFPIAQSRNSNSNFDLSVGLIITKCGSETGYGARFCGSFPHQKQAGETVLSLTNGLRGFGKEFEETLSQKGFLKNRSPLNPNLTVARFVQSYLFFRRSEHTEEIE